MIGISGQMPVMISAFFFFTDCKISVVHEGQLSTTHGINAGVPQGSDLGPGVFLYINDLTNCILSQLGI